MIRTELLNFPAIMCYSVASFKCMEEQLTSTIKFQRNVIACFLACFLHFTHGKPKFLLDLLVLALARFRSSIVILNPLLCRSRSVSSSDLFFPHHIHLNPKK